MKKCKCKSACFSPHTQTLHINKQPSLGTVFKSNRDKQILNISVLEPRKTSLLQNAFTLLLSEAKISSYLGKRNRNKNVREKHRYRKFVYSKRFGFSAKTKDRKFAVQFPFTHRV